MRPAATTGATQLGGALLSPCFHSHGPLYHLLFSDECLRRPRLGCCSSLRLEFLCDALPAAILLRLLPPLRCELQSDALLAAILLRLLLITAIVVSSALLRLENETVMKMSREMRTGEGERPRVI